MPSHEATEAEKAQCLLWTSNGLIFTDIRRKTRAKYRKSAIVGSKSLQCCNDYQCMGGHWHMSVMGVN